MKKSKAGAASATEKQPSSAHAKPQHPLEKTKSDLGGNTPRKVSAGDKGPIPSRNPINKGFVSKSQDNLASQLRRKAVAATLSQKEAANNKENVSQKDKTASQALRSKQTKSATAPIPKPPVGGDQGMPIKRAQSAQNIDKTAAAPSTTKPSSSVKRASSTQNISGGKGDVKVRTSAPVNIMAYNAELLASFEKEKKTLERRISELIQVAEVRKTEIEKFKFEVKNLKERIPSPNEEFDMIRNENRLLKDRLHELGVVVEHITDSEKLSMLQQQADSQNELKGATGGDGLSSVRTIDSELGLSVGDLSCITPEHPSSLSLDNSNWDKQSNKSSDAMSEVSVACLQDRILQMEETHYSTNEELQATLQELTDLQDSVNELSSENERLADERSVLLESLCAQTEKLENCRMQIEHLKVLLVSESEGGERSENERQLVALIKSAAEEREEFLLKQGEYGNALQTYDNENRELQDIITALRDRSQILEMKNESLLADKRSQETQISEMKETMAKDQIEVQRYKTLLENERSKVAELEQCHNATDKSDLEELLDNTRQEKDRVEAKLANEQEELAVSQNEVAKLREQISCMEEELKVSKNNAKTQVSDLEYRLDQVGGEKSDLQQEMETLRDHIDQLQQDCDRYLEEKKQHATIVADLQSEYKAVKDKMGGLETDVRINRIKFQEEQDEWRQFQHDLQTAVVIANDIKTETQEEMDRLKNENMLLTQKSNLLIEEFTKIHNELDQLRQLKDRNEIRGRVINTVDRELTALRQGRKLSEPWGGASQSLSVKNLIASIEQQVKTTCTPPLSPSTIASQESSRRNSMDSTFSSGCSSIKAESPTKTPENRRTSMPSETTLKSMLKKPTDISKDSRQSLTGHRHPLTNIIYEKSSPVTDDVKFSPTAGRGDTPDGGKKPLTSILSNKPALRKNSSNDGDKTPTHSLQGMKGDPLANLSKQMGGSKRNALLKWCQNRTQSYQNIDITNFSSSWNDGLAFCALLHTYLPDNIPYKELSTLDKRRNFTLAFKAAESVGIPATLNINDMVAIERPDWQAVMSYVTSIYRHFEVDTKS